MLHWYRDAAGVLTCGVGHAWRPEDGPVREGDPITEDQCEAFLAQNVGACEDAINNHVIPELTQNQFDALVSLAFNIGVSGFESSTVLRVINGSTEMPLEQAWELWDKDVQGGAKVTEQGLLARRKLEVALYLTPDATEVA